MENRKSLYEPIFEFFQRLAEQHARARAVAIEQEKPAVRFARQHAFYDRKYRRDAGAGGKPDIDPRLARRRSHPETAGRCHDIKVVTGLELIGRPTRERAAVNLFDCDAQFAVIRPGTDRIRPPHFFAVHGGAQRQILPGAKTVIVGERLWDRKGQRHRIFGFTTPIAYGEAMKTWNGGGHSQ